MTELELERIHAEIAFLNAQTAKYSKELKWYEVTLIIAITLAMVAVTKLFL